MGGRAQAGVGNIERAAIGTDVVLKIAVGVGRQLRLANQGHGDIVDHAQVFKVFQRLVRQLAVQAGRSRHANVPNQQRVAIGRCLGHLGGTNGAASTVDVFHHKVAARQGFSHGFAKLARHQVGGAASCKRHHQCDGLAAGVGLGLGHQSGGGGGDQKQAFHVISPV